MRDYRRKTPKGELSIPEKCVIIQPIKASEYRIYVVFPLNSMINAAMSSKQMR